MPSKISQCRFQENSVDKLLHEKNSETTWMEFTHHKAVSQKASFRCFSEDIFFVTIDFKALPNILLQIPRKQCYQTAQWKVWCNSVRWIHTSWSSFSESIFLVFFWEYFLFHYVAQSSHKYPYADSTKTVLANCFMKRKV